MTLDTVVDTFLTGASPEEIAQDFPVLRLDDVYAVLTYYLRHRDEVETYLRERRSRAEVIRREIESRSPQTGLRDILLAREASSHRTMVKRLPARDGRGIHRTLGQCRSRGRLAAR